MRTHILLLLAVAACNSNHDVARDGFTLAEATQRYCQTFKTELSHAANEYRTKRPNQYLSYGDSSHERTLVAGQLGRQLEHCVFARNIERARLDDISTRIALAQQGFIDAADLLASAGALDKLAAIATEIDTLPMRD